MSRLASDKLRIFKSYDIFQSSVTLSGCKPLFALKFAGELHGRRTLVRVDIGLTTEELYKSTTFLSKITASAYKKDLEKSIADIQNILDEKIKTEEPFILCGLDSADRTIYIHMREKAIITFPERFRIFSKMGAL